ncbi:putative oxygenase MesX, partial [Bacillus sp. SIMBA_008]|uniref:putative oxygenase MesX n=1 Tax=Bacillus sp. SIMBA_008 TaxID=3085757 RepID=UPI00397D8867
WDNPTGDRYALELDIVSVDLLLEEAFPVIEVLNVSIRDTTTGSVTPGIVGNNFSSYIRDYDFSVKLPNGMPNDFGVLHGRVFERFLSSSAYRERFTQDPVICISVSTSRTYE